MKKLSVAMCALVCLVSSVAAAPELDKQKVLATITQSYAAVFGVPNVFAAAVPGHRWYAAVDVVKSYVEKNGEKDVLLLQALALAERVSRDVVHTYDALYSHVFKHNNRSDEDLMKARQDLQRVASAQSELRDMQGKLQGQRYYIQRQRSDVRDVLVVLLGNVHAAVEKGSTDFDAALEPKFKTLPIQRPRLALR